MRVAAMSPKCSPFESRCACARPNSASTTCSAMSASAVMASALEAAWPDVALSGVVVTRYGHAVPTQRIEVVEAAHPVPDAAGLQAAERILELTQGLTADDLVLCLISGGGSALLTLPAEGIRLVQRGLVRAVVDGTDLSGCALEHGPGHNTVRRLRCVFEIRTGRAGFGASGAITLAPAEVPLSESDQTFFSASSK